MGHRATFWLLIGFTTVGLNLPGMVASSTAVATWPPPAPRLVLVAESSDHAAVEQPSSLVLRRWVWGLLALVALMVALVSGVILVLRQRRAVTPESGSGSNPTAVNIVPPTHDSHQASPAAWRELAGASRAVAPDADLDETTRLVPVNIIDTLIEDLTSRDGTVRRKAIWELGQRGHSAALQPLVNGLVEADSKERSLILAALAEISSRSLKPLHQALAMSLQDPSPEVRKNAIRDLTRIYDTAIHLSRLLSHATQDSDPEVQAVAHWALVQLNQMRSPLLGDSTPPWGAFPEGLGENPESLPP